MEIIEKEKYKEVLESGLLLDHYFLLCNIKNGKKIVDTKRMEGFINLMIKKEYLDKDGALTEKGLDLVEDCGLVQPIVVATEKEPNKSDIDFDTWVLELHKKCEDKLYSLTKQRQIRAKVERKTYPFIPNSTDLKKVLAKVIIQYKLKDHDKIEKAILGYIERCVADNDFFPLLQYYILKFGVSQMVTDINSPPQSKDDPGFKSNQKLV